MLLNPEQPTLYFIGVSTTASSIMRVFPDWADIWELDAVIEGVDLPLNAEPGQYQDVVTQIRDVPEARGALVTTHKLDLYRAASQYFDYLDPWAQRLGELSCISKRGSTLCCHAKDPLTAGLALQHFLPTNYWEKDAEVLCLGAGGAALAISLYLADTRGPSTMTFVDIDAERLAHLQGVHTGLDAGVQFRYLLHKNAEQNDGVLAQLPPGSLVINATGMGKDRPGSPLTDRAQFPEGAYVWELNYRGERQFLRQAQRQAAAQQLHVEDGWVYFLHGWTQVIAEVFDSSLNPELFAQLDKAAAKYR